MVAGPTTRLGVPSLPEPKYKLGFRKQKGRNGKARYLILDRPQVILKGVHDLVEKYVKNYSRKAATMDCTPSSISQRPKVISGAKKVKHGCNRGCKLDTQMGKTVKIYQRLQQQHPHTLFYENKVFKLCKSLLANEKKFLFNRLYMPEVRYMWGWMHKNGLAPRYTQLLVANEDIGRATGIDIVATDMQQRWVLLECKDGFKTTFFKHTGNNMEAPFRKENDSEYNQAHLQLLINLLLFRSTYPTLKDEQISPVHYVVRVDTSYIDSYPLEQWAVKGTQAFIKSLTK